MDSLSVPVRMKYPCKSGLYVADSFGFVDNALTVMIWLFGGVACLLVMGFCFVAYFYDFDDVGGIASRASGLKARGDRHRKSLIKKKKTLVRK